MMSSHDVLNNSKRCDVIAWRIDSIEKYGFMKNDSHTTEAVSSSCEITTNELDPVSYWGSYSEKSSKTSYFQSFILDMCGV